MNQFRCDLNSNAIPTWDYIEAGEYRYYDLFVNDDHIESLDVVITPNDTENMPFFLNGIISTTRPRATDPVLDDEWQLEWIENHGAVSSLSANDERFIKSNQYYITIHADADPEYFNFGDDGNGKGHPDHEGVDAMVYTISATATTSDMLDYRLLIVNL